MSVNVVPHLIGYPRIGQQRELKRTLEAAWSGSMGRDEFDARIAELRTAHLAEQRSLAGVAIDDFWLYDEVLETAIQLGIVPDRLRGEDYSFEVVTQLARGSREHEAWEMTKWFDTNYHYVVPEAEGAEITGFQPLPWREPELGSTYSVLGPYTLAKLSKTTDPTGLAAAAGAALWQWARENQGIAFQVNEPHLGLVFEAGDQAIFDAAYAAAGDFGFESAPLVSVQFGSPASDSLTVLGEKGFVVQVPHQALRGLADTAAWASQPEYLVSVVDGRSVWADDFAPVADSFEGIDFGGKTVRITSSASFMFLPYTTDGEDLPDGFQFAREKAAELPDWARAIAEGGRPATPAATVPTFPDVSDVESRPERAQRRRAQIDLNLPSYPTTTTGSLPQTTEVRKVRASFKRGEIDRSGYDSKVDELIVAGVQWQEELGLDVLVHGEYERTDMVEYFGEKMDGFHVTTNGWVQSYGSRCVRPPILAAPPSISEPMTVREWKVAQAATGKPVKGMLTGPVTIVNWSFRPPGVPDDRLFWAVAGPIAQEVAYLVEAGCRVIQIDEPAVRERWPLPTADAEEKRKIYSGGVRASLRRSFTAPPEVQLHTHMCYGDFADIVPLWSDVGVDVASIEWSRSKDDDYIELFYDAFSDGHLQIGPGVFDVHSPHSPGEATMAERLKHFEGFMDVEDLWVNPDCGLKTRTWEEIEVQLADLVSAAAEVRSSAGS
jgi:5-methyltetrahydropteroyltriglutamate--homocysteine methyltransferase